MRVLTIVLLASTLFFSANASALSGKETIRIEKKINPTGELTKLEVILGIKDKYKGDILKVVKKNTKYKVIFLKKTGELINIKVESD